MKTYKVTGYYKGTVYAQYNEAGWLMMLFADNLSSESGCPPGWDMFPLKEFDLQRSEMLTAKELKAKSVADKVAMFCMLYKNHKGITYRAMKEEKANLKSVTVNEQLLNTYFATVQYPLTGIKTMADYVRHYNAVRDLATNGKPVKNSFPEVYDKQYEAMIGDDVSKLQRYWAHLRAQGWKKADGVWIKN